MPLKVYYLDDEPELCENFVDYFATAEVEVTTFVDQKTAIETITLSPPDILFLDYRLLGTTGDEVAKALNPEFPVFLITGDISVRTEYPFVQVFSKPYPEQKIIDLIQSFTKKKVA